MLISAENCNEFLAKIAVAPYVGAWIETYEAVYIFLGLRVAPYVGAWIETCIHRTGSVRGMVAPYVGAWIETTFTVRILLPFFGRSLRGSVD